MMDGEIWVPAPRAPWLMVSGEGRVMYTPYYGLMPNGAVRVYGGKPSRGKWSKRWKKFVLYSTKRKVSLKIHRLVCEAFHGPPPFGHAVALHLDENSANNRGGNLQWGTQKENLNAPGFLAYCRSRTGENSPRVKARNKERENAMSNAVDEFVATAKAGTAPRLAGATSLRRSSGRLIFSLDATASRQATWDMAAGVTYEMFRETGGLDVQLCYFRGLDEFRAFECVSDPNRLVKFMGTIRCASGLTQINKVLDHARAENARLRVGALVFVGDALEGGYDRVEALREAARSLGAPAFMFHEGDDPNVKTAFEDIASISGGAYARFEPGAAK
jgi:hypothetical protein